MSTTDDVTAVIKPQHDHVKELLQQVKDSSGQSRVESFHTLRLTLALHESAEERAIHPQADRQLGGDAPAATDRVEEEQEAGTVILQLEDLDIDSDEFDSSFAELASSVVEHARAEEEREWPALREISDPQIVRGMIEQMDAVTTLADDLSAPDVNASFSQMQEWAQMTLPRPPV